ncbi:MAG: hypothetical protein ACJA0N_000849 [Pseudohongiellaceae bacterium]|jgi:hypothetical protein
MYLLRNPLILVGPLAGVLVLFLMTMSGMNNADAITASVAV